MEPRPATRFVQAPGSTTEFTPSTQQSPFERVILRAVCLSDRADTRSFLLKLRAEDEAWTIKPVWSSMDMDDM
jgi:hypothetical protein